MAAPKQRKHDTAIFVARQSQKELFCLICCDEAAGQTPASELRRWIGKMRFAGVPFGWTLKELPGARTLPDTFEVR